MSVLSLILGVVLLLYGRTLYWVFVAAAGFFVGVELGTQLLADQAEWVRILAAVAGGILGAILGMLAQRVAFSFGGLFAGGYLGLALASAAELPGEPLFWFAVGGIMGAIIRALEFSRCRGDCRPVRAGRNRRNATLHRIGSDRHGLPGQKASIGTLRCLNDDGWPYPGRKNSGENYQLVFDLSYHACGFAAAGTLAIPSRPVPHIAGCENCQFYLMNGANYGRYRC
jgi:hypothetical protein